MKFLWLLHKSERTQYGSEDPLVFSSTFQRFMFFSLYWRFSCVASEYVFHLCILTLSSSTRLHEHLNTCATKKMNKLDQWDAQIRDNEMKFEKDDISDTMRQAALFAMALEAVVENTLAGRRDLDNYAKVRCIIDDMIREKRGEPSNGVEEAINRRRTSTS